ncbi:MAG: cytochrome c [Deltaproteobacteria bacterium]|nr:cytochrome c [Deltaproteobacteria bacterium]
MPAEKEHRYKIYRLARIPLFAGLLAVSLLGCSGEKSKTASPAPESAQAVSEAKPGDPKAGKEIYFRYCHFCHGQRGMGDGPVGIALSPHPADFVNDSKRMAKTDPELFKSITEGIHKEVGGESMSMPRWQEILSEKERWDVLSFIRQLEREGKQIQK